LEVVIRFVDIGGIVDHYCLEVVVIRFADIGGQQFNQYQQNKRKFKQWWSTIQPISTKQKKV
jgi:hypothetical protein